MQRSSPRSFAFKFRIRILDRPLTISEKLVLTRSAKSGIVERPTPLSKNKGKTLECSTMTSERVFRAGSRPAVLKQSRKLVVCGASTKISLCSIFAMLAAADSLLLDALDSLLLASLVESCTHPTPLPHPPLSSTVHPQHTCKRPCRHTLSEQ